MKTRNHQPGTPTRDGPGGGACLSRQRNLNHGGETANVTARELYSQNDCVITGSMLTSKVGQSREPVTPATLAISTVNGCASATNRCKGCENAGKTHGLPADATVAADIAGGEAGEGGNRTGTGGESA